MVRKTTRSRRSTGRGREDRGTRGKAGRGRETGSRRGGTASKKDWGYTPRSYEQMKKQATQTGGMYDSPIDQEILTFSPRNEGDYTVRILPPTWEGAEHWAVKIFIHYGIGPDNQVYLCREKMDKGNCPLCEERREAEAEGQTDYAGELAPTKRYATWIIDRDSEDDGPMIWLMPWSLDAEICDLATSNKTREALQLDNPDDGFDVDFTRRGLGMRTKYQAVRIARNESPIADDGGLQEEWMSFVHEHPLPECLVFYDEEHINRVFAGQAARREDDEEEERPRREKAGRGRSGRGREEEAEAETVDEQGYPDEATIGGMTDAELDEVVDEHKLDLDLGEFSTLRRRRRAVSDAIEQLEEGEAGDGEEEEPDEKETGSRRSKEDADEGRSRSRRRQRSEEKGEEEGGKRGSRGGRSSRGRGKARSSDDDGNDDPKPRERLRGLTQGRRKLDDD